MTAAALTPTQIRIAHALASYCGSRWAVVITADEAVEAGSADAIRDIVHLRRAIPERTRTVQARPRVESGHIAHGDLSDPVSWDVAPDGTARIWVHASNSNLCPVVARATIRDGKCIDSELFWETGCRWRHLRQLKAVCAVLGADPVRPAGMIGDAELQRMDHDSLRETSAVVAGARRSVAQAYDEMARELRGPGAPSVLSKANRAIQALGELSAQIKILQGMP
jgi:hypothetical protein